MTTPETLEDLSKMLQACLGTRFYALEHNCSYYPHTGMVSRWWIVIQDEPLFTCTTKVEFLQHIRELISRNKPPTAK